MFSYGTELPPLALIKNFLNFYVLSTKGKLYDKPTVETVHNTCNSVTTYLHRTVGKKYLHNDLNDLYNVCEPVPINFQLLRLVVRYGTGIRVRPQIQRNKEVRRR